MIILQSANTAQQDADYAQLSPDQQAAVDAVMENIRHRRAGVFFLTGPAGTGKSFVIRYMATYAEAKVTATTGIAAQLIGGVTIHALTGWRPYSQVPNIFTTLNAMSATQLVIVDEISMLDARFFQAFCDTRLQGDNPYTILVVGDFLQLPPVNKPEENKLPCYRAPIWPQVKRIILTTQHRQSDPEFIAALGDIRVGKVTARVRALIAERSGVPVPHDVPRIMPKNFDVGKENGIYLEALFAKNKNSKRFIALAGYASDNHDPAHKKRIFEDRARLAEKIWLVDGARVIFLISSRGDWCNGTLGTIVRIPAAQGAAMTVQLDTGAIVEVKPMKEEFCRPDGEIESTVTQYPIKVAFALSVHRAQGQTLEKAMVDLSNPYFAPGQKYVALSRVKTKQGLYLKGSNIDLMVDPDCLRESGISL